jgi:hypothetical protein
MGSTTRGAGRACWASFTASGHGLDLDELSGPAEDRHAEQRARRTRRPEDLLHQPPHDRQVGIVGGRDVDGRLDDVLRSAASGVEGDKQVVENLARLARDVTLG